MQLVAKLFFVKTHFFELGNVVRLVGMLVVVILVWLVVLHIVLVVGFAFVLGPVLELELVLMQVSGLELGLEHVFATRLVGWWLGT